MLNSSIKSPDSTTVDVITPEDEEFRVYGETAKCDWKKGLLIFLAISMFLLSITGLKYYLISKDTSPVYTNATQLASNSTTTNLTSNMKANLATNSTTAMENTSTTIKTNTSVTSVTFTHFNKSANHQPPPYIKQSSSTNSTLTKNQNLSSTPTQSLPPPNNQPWVPPNSNPTSRPVQTPPPKPAGPPKPTRQDYARITREVYSKSIDAIKSLDLRSKKRKLVQIHFPVGPSEFQRRFLVRSYQIDPYKDKYPIDFIFVMGEVDKKLMKAIKHENDTYGDLRIIPGYADSREGGRTTKTPEYYKYLENHTTFGDEYMFVGRLDSDCFVNFDNLFGKYFTPKIQEIDEFAIVTGWVRDLFGTIFGSVSDWPQGSFYLFSWKTMLLYNRFYTGVPRELTCDDELIGRYLYDSQVNITDVRLSNKEAFDLNDMKTWGQKFLKADAVRVHELKAEDKYLAVATDILSLQDAPPISVNSTVNTNNTSLNSTTQGNKNNTTLNNNAAANTKNTTETNNGLKP